MFFVFLLNAICCLTAASFYWRDISFREPSKSKAVNNSWFAYLRLRQDPLVSAFNQESPTQQDEDLGRLFRLPGRPGAALLGRGSNGVGHLEEDAFGEIDCRCAALLLNPLVEGSWFREHYWNLPLEERWDHRDRSKTIFIVSVWSEYCCGFHKERACWLAASPKNDPGQTRTLGLTISCLS